MSPDSPRPHRPDLAPGYGISPQSDGLLGWDHVVERLEGSRNYWISTTRADGRPHVAPVWGVVVAGSVVFGCDPESVKARNIESGSAVAVHLESGDEAVIIEGRAVPVTDEKTLGPAAEAFKAKYGLDVIGDGSAGAWYRVEPRVAFAWLESEFPATATRFKLGDQAES